MQARQFRILIQLLIVYSIVTMSLETMPELADFKTFFWISEIVVVAIFSVEYIVNWRVSRSWMYPLKPLAIIDLLAILPFYLRLGIDLRGLRAIRLLRIFRLLKLGRYSRSLQMLGEAGRRSLPELSVFAMLMAIMVWISAMCVYYAEHEAQPEVFSSIPASLWWAVVTLTTVGYGDAYPVTSFGKVVASFIMIAGIGFIAVPTSIVTSTLSRMHHEQPANMSSSR